MKRLFTSFLFSFLFTLVLQAADNTLHQQLSALPGISRIEALSSDHYTEKYVVYITQPLDHINPSAGTFTQRVIVNHLGFDRPTVIVTEGYGAAYALRQQYQDELSRLFNTNVIVVEHRYFLESTPTPVNWDYLTAENSAYDLHRVNTTFRSIYPGKWISTGISKGGQTTMLYRAYFPDDVDISVPYVGPLNKGVEDGRHEKFLRKVGNKQMRRKVTAFQTEILKRKAEITPLLEAYCKDKELTFNVPMEEVLDYCVLEYSFAFWQWGTSTGQIPLRSSDSQTLFDHLMKISGPDYFTKSDYFGSFFVQAARELGYYGYDVKPFRPYLSITSSDGYLKRLILPANAGPIAFNDALYRKVYNYLKENDPQMIFIYGEFDPWSATAAPRFKGKKNEQIYVLPKGSHTARISNMPDDLKEKILTQINIWLAE